MQHLLITFIFSVTVVTLFAQFPHRPKPKPKPTQQQDESVPLKKDNLKPVKLKDKKEDQPEAVVEYSLSRIDLIGYQFEKSINDKGTVVFGLHSNFSYPYFDNGTPRLAFGFIPKIELGFRSYYSLDKRRQLNKPYQYNTGPYISGRVEFHNLFISFDEEFTDYTLTAVGLLWGFQNNAIKPITINFEIGPGFGVGNVSLPGNYFEGGTLVILGKLEFGFLLGR